MQHFAKVFSEQTHSQAVKLTDGIGFGWLLKRFVVFAKRNVCRTKQTNKNHNIINSYRFGKFIAVPVVANTTFQFQDKQIVNSLPK